MGTLLPISALAHVKWFCATADPSAPPLGFLSILSPVFYEALAGFVVLLFIGIVADGWIARRWPKLVKPNDFAEHATEKLMRVAVGAFFLCLWDGGAVVPWADGKAILTPELVGSASWISVLQFVIAVSMLWRRTCLIGAIGILAVYVGGIVEYGVFHMIDYTFFVGIAGYMALTSMDRPQARKWRGTLVCASLAGSLMWTAIEKFLYPQWTILVLYLYPNITVGLPAPIVAVIAGFVEFTLAFFLLTGIGLLRLGAAILLIIFVAAVPEFGHLDAVGHFTIVAILGLVCVQGTSPLQVALRPLRKTFCVDASTTVTLYLATFGLFFAMYYGVQALEYR